nr:hypothetical protein Iba_chr12aCG3300 [Ipomoea batatas]
MVILILVLRCQDEGKLQWMKMTVMTSPKGAGRKHALQAAVAGEEVGVEEGAVGVVLIGSLLIIVTLNLIPVLLSSKVVPRTRTRTLGCRRKPVSSQRNH